MKSRSTAAAKWHRIAPLAAILFGLVSLLSIVPVVRDFNLRLADTLFRVAPEAKPSPVVLVLIDDPSLRAYGRWPWSRTLLAELVNKLDEAGAQIIGLDILFAEPQSSTADEALARAMRESRGVVLADKIASYPDGPRWTEPIPTLASAAVGVGHAQAVLDNDGVCRRFPLYELTLDGPREAFALALARKVSPLTADRFLAAYAVSIPEDQQKVATASPVLVPVSFRRGGFETVSAADVLSGRNLPTLKGRPVLVGFGAAELGDRLSTPLSGQLPTSGVEIHAQILDSILNGRVLHALPMWLSSLLLMATCVCAISLLRNRHGWTICVLGSAFGAIVYFVGWCVFVLQSRIPPVGPMILAVVFTPVVVYAADLVNVERSVRKQMMNLRERLLEHRRLGLSADSDDITKNIDVLQDLQTELGALYESQAKLLETTHEAIAIFDNRGTLILQNGAFARLFGGHPRLTNIEELKPQLHWADNDSTIKDGCLVGEARVSSELFHVREVPLTATTLSPQGGTIWMLSSLREREERDRSRAEVLGFITHELRTPLTAIQGFSELMLQFPNSAQNGNAPETIFRESKRLLALIHSYLDVLRLDAGARSPAMEEVNVRDVVHGVFEVMQPIASTVGMILEWKGEPTSVIGDAALLHGALLNVVSNAIKYGDRGTKIEVRCETKHEEVTIAVHNFGQPISASDLPNLFSSYYRGSGAEGRAAGWGLGLAFVKRIAEKHRGHVSLDSDGNGTTFHLHFPTAAPVEVEEKR